MALNAEAEIFISHLIHIADEKDLRKIIEIISRMNLDNQSLFAFLSEVELHVSIYNPIIVYTNFLMKLINSYLSP